MDKREFKPEYCKISKKTGSNFCFRFFLFTKSGIYIILLL